MSDEGKELVLKVLGDDQVREVIGHAIMDALGPDAEERLVKYAVKYMITGEVVLGGPDQLPPISRLVNEAVEEMTRQRLHEFMQDNAELQDAIQTAVRRAVTKWLRQGPEILEKRIVKTLNREFGEHGDWRDID